MLASDEVRLRHMLDAARKAVAFASSRPVDDIAGDELLALALVRLIEIIGEAAKSVSGACRTANPELPWREMAGARDRLIHGYQAVDLEQVRTIVEVDLPPLIARLESILGNRP